MKKQKFEVGQRIAFTIYSGRHKGKIINVTENFIVVHCAKRNEIYSFWFTHSEYESYKIKRLVKKKKSMSVQEANEQINKVMGAHDDHITDSIRYTAMGVEKPVNKLKYATGPGIVTASEPVTVKHLDQAPKRAAREWWLVKSKTNLFYCRNTFTEASGFSIQLYGSDFKQAIVKVREVLDEQE